MLGVAASTVGRAVVRFDEGGFEALQDGRQHNGHRKVDAYYKVRVILGKFRIHSSRLVARQLERLDGRVRLHFLPPYCPDHNRIEREWQELHANVTRNHRCADMIALLVHATLFLLHRLNRRQVKPSSRQGLPTAA